MQVQIIRYMNDGDDEIETFFRITSHRWSWVNIYKVYTEWTLGPKGMSHALVLGHWSSR